MQSVLAMDFGGTRLKLGVVRAGQVVAETTLPARAHEPVTEVLADARMALERMWVDQPTGVAVGFPAIIDRPTGRILTEHGKYPGCRDFSFPDWVRRTWNLPAAVENDARLALIGEWQHGAGRGCRNLALVTLGTGIGTAVLLNGTVLRGVHHQAGNLGGFFVVNWNATPGTVESESASHTLPAEFPNYEVVFGAPAAQALKERALRVWGALAVTLVHAFDPERIIFGGGVMRSAAVILPAVQARVDTEAFMPGGRVPVVAGELGDRAALLGAEWLLQERL
ncbi:MAG: Beta-glucoside kinase [Verrucomicrobiae bacterium]|nr:Beta-glucoside kinase [Verrucomicrobiae bacterium]